MSGAGQRLEVLAAAQSFCPCAMDPATVTRIVIPSVTDAKARWIARQRARGES